MSADTSNPAGNVIIEQVFPPEPEPDETRVSLAPLSPETALRGLLGSAKESDEDQPQD